MRASVRVSWLGLLLLLVTGRTSEGQIVPPRPADVTPVVGASAVPAGGTVRAALEVELAAGLHTNAHEPRDPGLIPLVLTVTPPAGVTVTEIVYPEGIDFEQRGAAEPLLVYERQFTIGVQFQVDAGVPPGTIAVPARLRYQACDDAICYFPTTVDTRFTLPVVASGAAATAREADVLDGIAWGTGETPPVTEGPPAPAAAAPLAAGDPVAMLGQFELLGSAGGYIDEDDFLTFIRNAEAGVQAQGWFEDRGVLAILLIVLGGGLALNLTPCVLPMIPINLAIIGAGAQAGSRRRGFLLGSAYGLAMAAVYGLLGLVVIMTAGTFGTINASPWFNVTIAAIFVVLALAMFDVFTIDFSRFGARLGPSQGGRGSFVVAFGMGAVAALLAGACVAPVVIQVVLFSSNLYATGTTAALALPFLLGVGMAIPWPLAGAGISAIPRPGAWMVRVKQAFGVVILATAAYYGYLGYTLFADRWVDAGAVTASVEEKLEAGWYASLEQGLAEAQREGKPVLVDFWATWCKNCLVMDETTLAEPAVTSALDGYVKVKFQAEDLSDPVVRRVMQRVGAVGLPTYVILRPGT